MSSIGNISGSNPLSMIDQRNKDDVRNNGSSSFSLANLGQSAPVNTRQPYDTRAEQSFEESFAKMRIGLPSRVEGFPDDPRPEEANPQANSGDDVVQQFMDYMNMSTAEKLRDSMLKELGLTEEELEAMPPEEQKAVEQQLAEMMKQRADLQAAEGVKKKDPDEEQAALLS